MTQKKIGSSRLFWVLQFLLPFLVLIGFARLDGPYLGPDSYSYIDMSLHREPFYPLFLFLFRQIFSAETWMLWVIAVQALLTACANFSLTRFLTQEFSLSRKMSTLLSAVLLFFSLLPRFLANRHVLYSNSILVESIAIPLFLLFVRYLTAFVFVCFRQEKRIYLQKDFLIACLLSLILITIRKQMLITFFLLMAAAAGIALARKKPSVIFQTFAAVVLTAVLSTGIDLGYNYIFHEEAVRHSSDDRFLLTMVFYTADRADADRIADEETRGLFLWIYDTCRDAGYLKSDAGGGWLNRVSHFGDHYDNIQIDTLKPAVTAYVEENYPGMEADRAMKEDAVMREMTYAVLPACVTSVMGCFLDSFLFGLVTTVTKTTPLLIAAAAVLYAGYLFLLLRLALLRSNPRLLIFSAIVLLSILVNVAVVSAVIFCQSRYTIYNMALFYVSGLLMLSDAVSGIVGRRRGEKTAPSGTAA